VRVRRDLGSAAAVLARRATRFHHRLIVSDATRAHKSADFLHRLHAPRRWLNDRDNLVFGEDLHPVRQPRKFCDLFSLQTYAHLDPTPETAIRADAMEPTFNAHNDLETKLVAAQQGKMDSNVFMEELLDSQIFMPVEDEPNQIQGFQRSTKASPLTLENEDGVNVLVLFTSPERAKGFLQEFPAYSGGLLTEFSWILSRIGSGVAVSINPGMEFGIDLDTHTVEQLIHLSNARNQGKPGA